MIWWLHITDLHLKKGGDADQQNFCEALLKSCTEQKIKADFVVATGDFHNFKDFGDYCASLDFLPKLMAASTGDYATILTTKPDLLQAMLGDFDSYRKLASTLIPVVLGHHSFHDLHRSVKEWLVQMFNQSNVWAYFAGDAHRPNYHSDDYLIDRKTQDVGWVWPNIVAGKTSATIGDSYSESGVVLCRWDEHSTAALWHLHWGQKVVALDSPTWQWRVNAPSQCTAT